MKALTEYLALTCSLLALTVSNAVGEEAGAVSKSAGLRVAAVSFVPAKFDLAGNADRLERAFREAKAGGAELAVAPEGSLEGYVVNEIIAGEAPAERVYEVDPLICARCGGEMKVVAFIEPPRGDVIEKILHHCGL